MRAALKGAQQIGFTVVSLTVSLIAVFIPLLFMGGLVGRLFREFALTLAMAVVVSAVVSLTLTPMMCARLLQPPTEAKGRVCALVERFLMRWSQVYDRSLNWVLRHNADAARRAARRCVLTVWLYVVVPKASSAAGHRADHRRHRGRARRLVCRNGGGAERRRRDRTQDPDVNGSRRSSGADAQSDAEQRPAQSRAQAARRARKCPSTTSSRACRPGSRIPASPCTSSRCRTSRSTRAPRAPVPVHAGGRRPYRARHLGRAAARGSQRVAGAARRRQRISRTAACSCLTSIARRRRAPRRHHAGVDETLYGAFGQRQVATIYTPAQPVPRRAGGRRPQYQPRSRRPVAAAPPLRKRRRRSRSTPIARVRDARTAPLAVTHQGQFPAVTSASTWRPARRSAMRSRHRAPQRDDRHAADSHAASPATPPDFRESLASQPLADPGGAHHRSTSCSACSTRASSTRSRSCRPCPPPASARCSR